MSTPGKKVGYKNIKKYQTSVRNEAPPEDDLSKEVEEMQQKIKEAQKKLITSTSPDEPRIFHDVSEDLEEQKRTLRGIFRDQNEPTDKFNPVNEPTIYSFRKLEEMVLFLLFFNPN